MEKVKPGNARAPGIAEQIARRLEAEMKMVRSFNDPRGVYARLPVNLSIR
ncbi:MAG: hypothetical protein RLZZ15_4012, partial [Verrucomicrobiota bacterium]|jgi:protease-4